MTIRRLIILSGLALTAFGANLGEASGACGQEYRVVCKTVYEEREVTCYRIEQETVCEQRQVVRRVPVWETEARERRYTVLKPVRETCEREERYCVQRPVWETVVRDCSYDQVRTVSETCEREERYSVQRPVWETSCREERYCVQRPVWETAERQVSRTVMRPVTTCRTVLQDQGCWGTQCVAVPGAVSPPRLAWLPSTEVVDPQTGQALIQRGGLSWARYQAPTQQVAQRVWRPNVVAQQVTETQCVPQQVVERVPYQVCRMVNEEQDRKVPVQT